MIRLLLLGSSGQLGSALNRRLAARCQLTALSRQELDITQAEMVRLRLEEIRPQIVVNAAAWTDVDQAESALDSCFAVNAEAPGLLAAESWRLNGAIVHFSSDYVFDGSGNAPWQEGDKPAALNVYGRSKRAGEEAVARSNPAHLILRTSWLYDAKGKNFLTTMLDLMRSRTELNVVADQIGAPTSTDALADAIASIVAMCGDRPAASLSQLGGLLHCACEGETSWHGFAQAILDGARERNIPLAAQRINPIAASELARQARRPANSRLSMNRLRADFGIKMPHWRTALSRVLDDIAGLPSQPDRMATDKT